MLVRRIHKRGANIVVEAHGEILFAATGEVGIWTNRFSHRVREFAAQEAPTNKRPRWAHYGKPLKSTFTASTTYQPGNFRVYSAVGSSSPHAYYVDQGTGVFNGSGPYPAKILPPYQWQGASLYEATWRPGGPGTRKVTPVMIKGQKGQEFFDKGLARGFRSMRMRATKVPGEPRISNPAGSIASGLAGFAGNTVSDNLFKAQLEEWREWRDRAWDAGEGLGRGGGIGSKSHQKFMDRAASQAAAKTIAKPKSTTKTTKPTKTKTKTKPKDTHKQTPEEIHNKQRIEQEKQERARLKEFISNKFPGSVIRYDTMDLYKTNGRFHWVIVVTVNGRIHKYDVASGLT